MLREKYNAHNVQDDQRSIPSRAISMSKPNSPAASLVNSPGDDADEEIERCKVLVRTLGGIEEVYVA